MRNERGMVTVELAFGLMASAVASVAMAYLVALVVQLGQCQATAGEVARQEARGDAAASAKAQRDAPPGAAVRISRSGPDVLVLVELRSRPFGEWIPALPLTARAVVAREVP